MSQCSWAGGSGIVNNRWSPPFLDCPVNRQCLWKKTLIDKEKRFRSEPDIEEYEEYPYEEKYQLLINKREGASIKCCNDCQAFIEILEWYGWYS